MCLTFRGHSKELSIVNKSILPLQLNSKKNEIVLKDDNGIKKIPTLSLKLTLERLKNFHLLELSQYRENFFKDFVIKEFYLSLLPSRTRFTTSSYINPSIINRRYDDYENGEISQFDWIVLDEFYNNKKLKDFMFYKTEVIPILTEAIYKRLQGVDNSSLNLDLQSGNYDIKVTSNNDGSKNYEFSRKVLKCMSIVIMIIFLLKRETRC